MPTANIYFSTKEQKRQLREISSKLKVFLADILSCGEIYLTKEEISVRFISIDSTGMIGDIEIEITAFAFAERVKKQDEICLQVRSFIQKAYPKLGEIKVWLILAELGHSWEQ